MRACDLRPSISVILNFLTRQDSFSAPNESYPASLPRAPRYALRCPLLRHCEEGHAERRQGEGEICGRGFVKIPNRVYYYTSGTTRRTVHQVYEFAQNYPQTTVGSYFVCTNVLQIAAPGSLVYLRFSCLARSLCATFSSFLCSSRTHLL